MSQKNHEITDGRLVQTDKKYSHLKLKQKEKIAEWMFQETRDFYTKKYTFPNDKQLSEVVDKVYEKIENKQIFGAPEIERVLKCSTSTAKNVMKKLREIGVVEEIKGKGKGKYTFISEFNYTKNVN